MVLTSVIDSHWALRGHNTCSRETVFHLSNTHTHTQTHTNTPWDSPDVLLYAWSICDRLPRYFALICWGSDLKLNQLLTPPPGASRCTHIDKTLPTRTKALLHSCKQHFPAPFPPFFYFFFAHKDTGTPKEGALPPGATSVTCWHTG